MDRLIVSVDHLFGYGALDRTYIEDESIDIQKVARDFGWSVEMGTCAAYFTTGTKATLEFGKRPDKKEMREMVKQAKSSR